MKHVVKTAIDRVLAFGGLKVLRIDHGDARDFPVEFDEADRAIIKHIVGRQLSMAATERLFSTLMACRYVCETGIEGDFVECGVWRGGNSLIAAHVFNRLSPQRKVYLFDTFEGMTAPTSRDVNVHGKQAIKKFEAEKRATHNEWCYASLDDVHASFEDLGLMALAKFVAGDVLKTLDVATNLPRQISVLRLDTDWYESTKRELEVLYPRLQVGGVLLLDDYGHWKGARQATDEYFARHGRPFLQYNGFAGRVAVKTQVGAEFSEQTAGT